MDFFFFSSEAENREENDEENKELELEENVHEKRVMAKIKE